MECLQWDWMARCIKNVKSAEKLRPKVIFIVFKEIAFFVVTDYAMRMAVCFIHTPDRLAVILYINVLALPDLIPQTLPYVSINFGVYKTLTTKVPSRKEYKILYGNVR